MNNFERATTCVLLLFLTACSTLEIIEDRTPTPDLNATSTVGALQAQNAELGTQVATLNPPSLPLAMSSTSDQIQHAMLESTSKWKTIWLDGVSTSYEREGVNQSPSVIREQVWIDITTNRFRVLTGSSEGPAEKFLACDGATVLEMDLKSGQSEAHSLPEMPRGPLRQVFDQALPNRNLLGGRSVRRFLSWHLPPTLHKVKVSSSQLPWKP